MAISRKDTIPKKVISRLCPPINELLFLFKDRPLGSSPLYSRITESKTSAAALELITFDQMDIGRGQVIIKFYDIWG